MTMRILLAALMLCLSQSFAAAQKKYGPGVTDAHIKIGNIMPYSGPAAAYGIIGKAQAAYFKMINDHGGVNGRKIEFISYDDAYSPSKAVEQARKLVESDEVLLIFSPLGTASNTAIQKYLNDAKTPQLFVATGAGKWNNPKQWPWTMGWQPSYRSEALIYAKHLLSVKPDAKLAVLYQNDDYGKEYLRGMLEGLGDKIKLALALPYETTDASVDAQVTRLAASGADAFLNISTPKFAAQAIRKAAELNWRPLHYLNTVSNAVGTVLKPAGLENAQGIISVAYQKDAADPQWKEDPGLKKWLAFMDRYMPGEDKTNTHFVYGYNSAQTLVHVLRQAGDDLTRENVMKQAASIKDLETDMLIPGVRINTAPDNYAPINQERLEEFRGDRWSLFGPVHAAD